MKPVQEVAPLNREADHWLMFETEADGPALQLESVDMPLTAREAFEDLED